MSTDGTAVVAIDPQTENRSVLAAVAAATRKNHENNERDESVHFKSA
jgi:hypothetical protein